MQRLNNVVLNPHQRAQQGFSAIGLVMMIFMFTLLLLVQLNALTQLTTQHQHLQIKHFQRENLALSVLAFGESQTWQTPTSNWQCLNYISEMDSNKYQAQVCLKLANYKAQHYPSLDPDSLMQFVLLKGEFEHITRFKLGLWQQNQPIRFVDAHWLDICPNQRGKNCEN